MKKILLASSALVLVGGAAFAEVTLSGSAEMGVFGADFDGDSGFADVETPLQFHTDLDVTFTMSGETDGGVVFGASIDLDEGGDGAAFEDPETQSGESIFVSGDFGTISMGDVNGALDQHFAEYIGVHGGSLQDNEETAAFNAASAGAELLDDGLDGFYDGQVARYDYSFDGFAFSVSAEVDDMDDGGEPVYGIGASYSSDIAGGSVTIGAGYQAVEDVNNDDTSVYGVSASLSLDSGLEAILAYGYTETDVPGIADDAYGVGFGLGYTFDAITIAASYAHAEDDDDNEIDGYGLTAGYDLGGGLELQAGYGYSDIKDFGEISTFSFGAAMSF